MRSLPHAVALLFAGLVLAGGVRGAVAGEEGTDHLRAATAAEWKSVRKLLPRWLWLADPARRRKRKVDEAWEALDADALCLDARQFAELAEILRAGSPYTTEKKRDVVLDVPTGTELPGGGQETMPVRVAVTTKYKPGCGRSFPLVITCHGGPVSDLETALVGSKTQFGLWKGYTSTLHCIVAAPALTGSRYGEREWTLLANLIDELDERYGVDRDRVLLTGHSWGGIVTWHLGPAYADRFSLIAPFVCATNPGEDHLANCKALPVYHVQGNRDGEWILQSGRERRDLLDELGYEHHYREPNGGHETFGSEVAKIADMFAERRRRLYAPELVRRPTRGGRNRSGRWYWVLTDDDSFDATCDPQERTIDLDVDGPCTVLLSDEMLDLDEPLTVRRAGEVVWSGTVQRSLAFALRHVRETGDRARVFAAAIDVP